MRKTILATLVTLAVVAMLPATASAQATATGSMAVDINLPDIVILYYYATVTIDIDAATLVSSPSLSLSGAASVSEGTTSGNGLTPDLAISASDFTAGVPDLSDVSLTLQNAWAVRALSSDGTVNVTFVADQATLDNAVAGSIDINSVTVTDGGSNIDTSGAPHTTPAAITINSPGLINPAVGDLGMHLDMSSATSSGAYNGSFTITASVP